MSEEDSVIILDDTEGVWSGAERNLIVIDRYHYFSSSAKAFSAGPAHLGRWITTATST